MPAIAAVYVLAVLLLCVGFYFAHLVEGVRQIAGVAGAAYSAMRDRSLDDLEKEKAVRRCALEMVKQTVRLSVKLLVILLAAAFPVWLANFLGWIDMEAFTRFALRVDVLLVTTAVIIIPVVAHRQIRKPGP